MRRQYMEKLPKFNGDMRQWAYFESLYYKTSEQGQFSNSENVQRLRQALEQKPRELVQSKLLFSEDADGIMKTLKLAYGNPAKLIVVLGDELMKFPNLKSETDPKLREFSLQVSNFVSNAESMNEEAELSSGYLLNKLSVKLSYHHLLQWTTKLSVDPKLDIRDFTQFLMQKVVEIPIDFLAAREASNQAAAKPQNVPKRLHKHKESDQSRSSRQSTSCLKCNQSHHISKCESFRSFTADERLQFAFANKICISCLSSKEHRVRDCPMKRSCNLDECKLPHHHSLHGSKYKPRAQNSNGPSSTLRAQAIEFQPEPDCEIVEQPMSNPTMSHQMSHGGDSNILFKILPVWIHASDNRVIDTFVFLDDGSSLTLIDSNLFDRLRIAGHAEELELQWTKGITRREQSIRSTICLSQPGKKKIYSLTNVYSVENLDLPVQSVDAKALRTEYSHLRNILLKSYERAQPEILIGLQHAELLVGDRMISGCNGQPIATKTRLGWLVFGQSASHMTATSMTTQRRGGVQLSIQREMRTDAELHDMVKSYFSTESFGVVPLNFALESQEEKRSKEIMIRTLKFRDGRYEIGLLWKSDDIRLPDSYGMAMKRLVSLEKSLSKTPNQLQWMNEHVTDLINKGYARKATPHDSKWPRVWYCPMFIVVNENKIPPKPRVVTDVAAYAHGHSLNSNLLKGPNAMTPMLKGLMRFRENKFAISADVKQMFQQIRIAEEDQQCQRFLWRDGDQSRSPTVYVMQAMMFGPTCSPACAQFVKDTHAKQFVKEAPEAVEAITDYTYVDDLLDSKEKLEQAKRLATQTVQIFTSMGFELVGFQSNSRELLESLPAPLLKSPIVEIDRNDSSSSVSKIVGLSWDTTSDHFVFKLTHNTYLTKMLEEDSSFTKREVLRVLMKIFDPLGLIAHFLIRGRMILQEIWREGIGWDEALPLEPSESWRVFISHLPELEMLRIPRQYANVNPHKCQVKLIMFVDASLQAYAATAYYVFNDGNVNHVAHAMAKARVAPIKSLTVPQLELQAAVMGVRLSSTIVSLTSFKIHEVMFLSDSGTVLSWICSTKFNFKMFVAARVGEILETSNPDQWYFVRSENNVADDEM
jgi:Pao retrotransposon peptidase/Protein of unknown function (DUF1759)